MRTAFENGTITEAMFNDNKVKITMSSNKCFEIREYNKEMNRYNLCFETSSKCDWEIVKRFVNSLIKI